MLPLLLDALQLLLLSLNGLLGTGSLNLCSCPLLCQLLLHLQAIPHSVPLLLSLISPTAPKSEQLFCVST